MLLETGWIPDPGGWRRLVPDAETVLGEVAIFAAIGAVFWVL